MTGPDLSTEMIFAGSPLDRASHLRDDRAWLAAQLADPNSRFLPLLDLKPLLDVNTGPKGAGGALEIAWQAGEALAGALEDGALWVFLGLADDIAHFAVDTTGRGEGADSFSGNCKFIDARAAASRLAAGAPSVVAQARSLVDWHLRHGFCATCGEATTIGQGGYLRQCTTADCGAQHFPRTDPVVIMLPVDGERCLLGRKAEFPANMFSALAGFLEPGESIEEAVRREVMEESGVRVGKVDYLAAQPWPFPSSLMIGCLAEALSTDISVDQEELEEARWFSRDELIPAMEKPVEIGEGGMPEGGKGLWVPPPMAIAHHLIKHWLIEF